MVNAVGLILVVIGLSISKPLPKDNFGQGFYCSEDNRTGTTVTLAVKPVKKKLLVYLDDKASEITEFKDDKETDLKKNVLFNYARSPNAMIPRSVSGKEALSFKVHSKALPAKDATALTLKGKAVVVCANSIKTVTTEEISLSKGQQIKLDPIDVTISEIAIGTDTEIKMTLETSKKIDLIRKVTLVLSDGRKIKGCPRSWGQNFSGLMGGDVDLYNITYYFELKQFPEKAKLSFVTYDGVENVTVPIDVKVTMGL